MNDLPEPSGKIVYPSRPYEPEWVSSQDAFSEEQMREYRNAALEEAARVCDELFADVPPYSAPDCAGAIRNLKEQK